MTFMDKFGASVDRFFGIFSPTSERERMQARQENIKARLAYDGARTGRDRAPAPPLIAPNSPSNQVDSVALMRRAGDQQRNNSFVNMLVQAMVDFTIGGHFEWIPNTGDPAANMAYRRWLSNWYKVADARGNHHFVDLVQMAFRGVIFQGNHGFIHHFNPDLSFQISSVRGQNIGNPQMPIINKNNIQGVLVDDAGHVVGYEIYRQTLFGTFQYVQTVPNIIFSHLNPVEDDEDYKNVSLLKTILNDTHDMNRLEAAWMKKIQWHAAKTAIVNPPNGSAPAPSQVDPDNLLSDNPAMQGIQSRLQEIVHGETMYGEPGMTIEAVRNETPTDQEMEYLEYKLQQIAGALGLPIHFVYVMIGISLPGTLTRFVLKRAQRTFQEGRIGQKWLQRVFLDEIVTRALWSAIARGEVPLTENWNAGSWMFTAHPSVDEGNDSDARLNENRMGIVSRSEICAARGRFAEDVDDEVRTEAKRKMMDAINLAKEISAETGVEIDWQQVMPHVQMMTPNGNEISSSSQQAGEEKAGAGKKSGNNTPQATKK